MVIRNLPLRSKAFQRRLTVGGKNYWLTRQSLEGSGLTLTSNSTGVGEVFCGMKEEFMNPGRLKDRVASSWIALFGGWEFLRPFNNPPMINPLHER